MQQELNMPPDLTPHQFSREFEAWLDELQDEWEEPDELQQAG